MPNRTCSIPDCQSPVKRRGYCYGHYMKSWRYGDPLHVARGPRVGLVGQRFGLLVVCEYLPRSGEASRWLCKCECGREHEVRTGDLNSGSVRTCGHVSHQLEPDAEYGAAHDRVVRARGKARTHKCVDCESRASQWSYDHADPDERHSAAVKGAPAFSLNPSHYVARCVPCHKRFDLGRIDAARTA